MNVRILVGLPVAVLAMVPVFAVSGAATAQAAPTRTFACTAQTWGGETLPTVQVEARKVRQAQGVAQSKWLGTAKFATIDCKPV